MANNYTVKLADKHPGFTLKDTNRIQFVDTSGIFTPTEIKKVWRDGLFTTITGSGGYSEVSTLEGRINVDYTDLEKIKTTAYLLMTINNFDRYYFVTKVTIKNDKVATLSLKLDTITTYLDTVQFSGNAKVHRRHYDRWKIDAAKSITANFDQDSGIWNDDYSINNQSFIKDKVISVNAISGDEIDSHPYIFKYKNGRKYFAYAFLSVKDGNNGSAIYYDYDYQTPTSAVALNTAPLGQVILPISNGDWGSHDEIREGNKARSIQVDQDGKITILASQELSFITLEQLNRIGSAYVKSIVYSPIPLNRKFDTLVAGEKNHYSFLGFTETDDRIVINGQPLTYLTESMDGSSRGLASKLNAGDPFKFENWDNTRVSTILSQTLGDNVLTLATLTEDRDYKRETKLLSSQHRKLELMSSNGQRTALINEFIFGEDKLDLQVKVAIDNNQSLITTTLNTPLYLKYNIDNSKTFQVSYKGQIPNASTPYNNFVATSFNSYKTALANNRIHGAMGIANGVLGTVAAGVVRDPIKGAKALFGIGSAVAETKMKEHALRAKVKDLHNLGSSTEVNDISFIKDFQTTKTSSFGDLGMAISVSSHPITNQMEISDHYNKLGYVSDRIERFTGYANLAKRALFSHWEVSKISQAMVKTNLPVEVLEEIDDMFNTGLTLWSHNTVINNFDKENWEIDIYKEIKARP